MANSLATLTQRLSYILGENMARQLKDDGLELANKHNPSKLFINPNFNHRLLTKGTHCI